MNRNHLYALFSGASLLALAHPALSQDAPSQGLDSTEPSTSTSALANDTIVVTARRRFETLQDVPLTVNPVTAEDFDNLNLRDLSDITSLVPGLDLSINANGIGGNASIRGVDFNVNASGNNPTVEFYLNDAPISGQPVLQSVFDVEQVEVLRGPQGTLRGRASPSGAITVRTKSPDLLFYDGYVNATLNDLSGRNIHGAVNIPILEDVLAVRVAGLIDESDLNQVATINPGFDDRSAKSETSAARVSIGFEPTDWAKFSAMYQHMERDDVRRGQVESLSIADPTAAPSPVLISAEDRLSIAEGASDQNQEWDIAIGQAELSFENQNLIYVGQYWEQTIASQGVGDVANVFPDFEFGQFTDTRSYSHTHELRLQNEARVAGMFDYVVGGLFSFQDPPSDLIQETPIALFGNVLLVNETEIARRANTKEQSIFGNVTAHLTDRIDVSGGLRRIEYKDESGLAIAGNSILDETTEYNATIYNATANYDFTENVTAYFNYGTSWRPGIFAIGDFSVVKSPVQLSFLNLPPEESESFEIGVKSVLWDGRARVNLAAYHQTFDNYPYRAETPVFYVDYTATRDDLGNVTVTPGVGSFNFIAGVPVEVNGIEADASVIVNDALTLGGTLSYADGEIQNGFIPCTDLNGDGVPDTSPERPTLEELLAVVGADNIAGCNVSQRSGSQSPLQLTLRGDYSRPVSDNFTGFLRGLYTYKGDSQTDPTNPFDDVDAYGMLNLYAGVREPDGRWEVSLFAKNIFDNEEVLSRGRTPQTTSFQSIVDPVNFTVAADSVSAPYRNITVTAPREVGVNVRYYFGGGR